jgi:hypothetical protein
VASVPGGGGVGLRQSADVVHGSGIGRPALMGDISAGLEGLPGAAGTARTEIADMPPVMHGCG